MEAYPPPAELDEEFENDPFDLTGKEEPPNLVGDIDWNELYDWKPRLLEVSTDTEKPAFIGRKSDIAQAVLHHLGKPLSLNNHAFLLPVFNDEDPRLVLKCSRQVAKSTTCGRRNLRSRKSSSGC